MRLIDADTIKTIDYSGLASISPNDYKGVANYFYDQLIVNQSTAYDVDKIWNEITDRAGKATTKGAYRTYWECAKIVKGAVKDE